MLHRFKAKYAAEAGWGSNPRNFVCRQLSCGSRDASSDIAEAMKMSF